MAGDAQNFLIAEHVQIQQFLNLVYVLMQFDRCLNARADVHLRRTVLVGIELASVYQWPFAVQSQFARHVLALISDVQLPLILRGLYEAGLVDPAV